MEGAKIKFIEVDSVKDLIMEISYTKNKKEYSNIYYIEDEKVNAITFSEPVTIDILYNIKDNEYEYYFHNKDDKKDNYLSLEKYLKGVLNGKSTSIREYVYTFKEDDVTKATKEDEQEVTLSNFDETFVEVETGQGKDFETILKIQLLKI